MRNGVRASARKPAKPVHRTVKKPFDKAQGRPFDIDKMMRRVREAVRNYPKAVLFELADRGYCSPFQILIACVITIRTLEMALWESKEQ